MKISFLSPPPNLSGGERVIAIYARELIRLGHQVNIVCSDALRPSIVRRLKSALKGNGFLIHQPAEGSHYEWYKVPYKVVARRDVLSESDIPDSEIVIATFWKTAKWMSSLPSNKGKKFYLIQGDEGALHGGEAESTYEIPARHVYVSQWISDRIKARHPEASGSAIPNAIDVDEFDSGPREKPKNAIFGMMWAGDTYKGGDVSVQAVQEARIRYPNLRLIGFGVESPPPPYASAFDQFWVRPSPERIAKIYQSCTGWLFTSRLEGFGLTILESMAARTPVIGSPTGAALELITPGGGLMVEMEDIATTSEAICQLHSSSFNEWQAMSEAAFKTAASWTWQDAAKQFEQVLLFNEQKPQS